MTAAKRKPKAAPQRLIEFDQLSPRELIHEQPLVRQLIKSAEPELLQPSARNEALLAAIDRYLLEEKQMNNLALKARVPELLYPLLFELKAQMKHKDLFAITRQVSLHKEEMRARLLAWQEEE